MAQEQKRGCGFRKVGGLYLRGGGMGVECHRLPIELCVCPCCGGGIKFSRGLTMITPKDLLGICESTSEPLCHSIGCFVCLPPEGMHGLLWVGEKYYTPESFAKEAREQGISKRIGTVPKNIVLGESIIYLAHPKAFTKLVPANDDDPQKTLDGKKEQQFPGIFYAFKPKAIEMIITDEMAEDEKQMEKLKKRGITPVTVSADDADHNPKNIKTWDDIKKKY